MQLLNRTTLKERECFFYVTGKNKKRVVSIQERGVKEGRKIRRGEERKGCD
jgi:hypothetical protein